MHNFLSIIKLQLKNMFRRDKEHANIKKTVGLAVVCAVLYAAITAGLIFVIYYMSAVMSALELESEFIALILTTGLLFVLIFGVVVLLTCLYFSKDTEFFLALPVKPSTVFAAKMAIVYLTELVTAALLMLPLMITAGIMMKLGVLYYVMIPFAIVFLPAIPLFIASIISIPIMYLVSFFRNRGALGSIFVLLLMGGLFAGYYVLVMNMQDLNPDNIDVEAVRNMFVKIVRVLYPLYALGRAMTAAPVFGLGVAASVAVNIFIFAASVAAFGVIALLISSAVYRRGAASQLEGSKKTKAVNAEYHGSSALKALMKKEFRDIIRTPAFALNCLLVIILCPIVVGFVGFSTSATKLLGEVGEVGEDAVVVTAEMIAELQTIMRYVLFGFTMFMGLSANIGPATAFSREGEKFYFSKIIPVDYATQVKAKSYVYILIGSVTVVVTSAVTAVLNFDAVFLICSIIFMLIYNFALVHFGLWLDLNRPKLKWVTPNEAMKHNRNANIYVPIAMLVSIALAVVAALTNIVFTARLGALGGFLSWALMFIAVITLAVLSAAFLYKSCEKKFEAVEM